MSEGMSEERLAELEAHYGRPYPEIASSRSALSTAVATVRLLLVEVKRLRGVERDLRATIADEHSRLSQDFENEEQLRRERDQARAELAAMREGLVAIYSPGDERGPYTDSSYTLAAAQAIVVDGGSVWTRFVGQWREVEGGGEHG